MSLDIYRIKNIQDQLKRDVARQDVDFRHRIIELESEVKTLKETVALFNTRINYLIGLNKNA